MLLVCCMAKMNQLKDYFSSKNYRRFKDDDDDDDLSLAESTSDDDDSEDEARTPLVTRKPVIPPRPLTPIEYAMQASLKHVGIVHPHRNSLNTWSKFFDNLAERIAYMDSVLTQFKTITDMRPIYEDKIRFGNGVVGWREAFKFHGARLIEMAQNVLDRK